MRPATDLAVLGSAMRVVLLGKLSEIAGVGFLNIIGIHTRLPNSRASQSGPLIFKLPDGNPRPKTLSKLLKWRGRFALPPVASPSSSWRVKERFRHRRAESYSNKLEIQHLPVIRARLQ